MKAFDSLACFPRVGFSAPGFVIAMCSLSFFFAASPIARGVPIDSSLANFTSRLPVLVLCAPGGALNAGDPDRAVRLDLLPPENDAPLFASRPLVSTAATARVRESSSALAPKKSYSLQLLGVTGQPALQSLLGLAADDTWDLVSPWNYDRTFLHNAYLYSLSRSLGRWASHTTFVEVFTCGDTSSLTAADYVGISLLTERVTIDATHVNLTALAPSDIAAPAITGGYLLKISPTAASDVFTFTTPHLADWKPSSAIAVYRPTATNLPTAQRDYIRGYVQSMEAALYADAASGWSTHKHLLYLDRASWVDYHLLQVLSGNVDALARNFYFTKDRDGKLTAGPLTDCDRALGSADPRNAAWDQWNSPDAVDVWNYGWWGLLTHDPDFMQAWIDRWQALRRNALATDKLTTLAENLAAQIGPAAAARDAARWPDDTARFSGGWAGEIAQMKSWVAHRAAWIDAKFVAPPTLETDGVLLSATAPAGAKLVYTLDGSDPYGPNGQLALLAQVATGPLVFDAASLLCVRAWNPAIHAFPGSPWSAPLTRVDARFTGAETNPAFQSRLASLSTFVHLGPGSGAPLTGFVITGDKEKQILVRAVGPGLRQFGLSGTLADPVISVLDGRGVEIARNAGWTLGRDALDLPRLTAVAGAFQLPPDSADSALVLRLAPGSYTIVVASATDATGTALAEVYELDRTGSFASLATCSTVHAAAPMLAGGFIVRGSAPRKFLIRAIGPALAAWGVNGPLAEPALAVASATGLIARNGDWTSPTDAIDVAAAAKACGAFPVPTGGRDAALIVQLAPGSYTAQVTSKDGGSGVVLLEIYGVP